MAMRGGESVWQDRKVSFDIPPGAFLPRRGEFVIDSINAVEDTKGNNGIRGSLAVTNLRLTWCAHTSTKVNLSIGLNNISRLKIKTADSKLRGTTQALFVMATHEGIRYEFIFTSLVNSSPRLYTTVQAVHRAYETSRLFRELKLRGAIIKDQALKVLPGEEMYQKLHGVWNLSSDQGNLGTFVITNIRIVWFADLANNFNVSIPYLQIKALRTKESKFGKAMVIETSKTVGGYVLGFRIDPAEKLAETFETVQNLHALFSKTPNFGVSFSFDSAPKALDQVTEPRVHEDLGIIDDYESDIPNAFAASKGRGAYITHGGDAHEAKDAADEPILPQYNADLGVAVQPLPAGATVAKLWALMSR